MYKESDRDKYFRAKGPRRFLSMDPFSKATVVLGLIAATWTAIYLGKYVLRLLRFPQSTPSTADFKNRQQYGASLHEIENAMSLDLFPYGNLIVHLEAP